MTKADRIVALFTAIIFSMLLWAIYAIAHPTPETRAKYLAEHFLDPTNQMVLSVEALRLPEREIIDTHELVRFDPNSLPVTVTVYISDSLCVRYVIKAKKLNLSDLGD